MKEDRLVEKVEWQTQGKEEKDEDHELWSLMRYGSQLLIM